MSKEKDVSKYSIVKNSHIGKETIIRGHTNLYKAKIGKKSKIGAFVYVEPDTIIGNNVVVRPFTHICEGVTIEDGVFVGPHVCFTNDLYPNTKVRNKPLKTLVKKNAMIGAASLIFPVVIGKGASVGAGSVVTKDVPDNTVVAGVPAVILGKTTDSSFVKKQKMRNSSKDPRKKA